MQIWVQHEDVQFFCFMFVISEVWILVCKLDIKFNYNFLHILLFSEISKTNSVLYLVLFCCTGLCVYKMCLYKNGCVVVSPLCCSVQVEKRCA